MGVFEQYNMQVYHSYRERGGFVCNTDKGIVLLREYNGNEESLTRQKYITDFLVDKNVLVDDFVINTEGKILTEDEDGKVYYVKRWFEGEECDSKNPRQLYNAMRALGTLHKVLNTFEYDQEKVNEQPEVIKLFEKHNRELKSARNYLHGKKKKNRFEEKVYMSISEYIDKAKSAKYLLSEHCSVLPQRNISHNNFNQHNVLIGKNGCIIINYSRAAVSYQVLDIYDFMRKMLEKYDWEVEIGLKMLREYEQSRKLSTEEKNLLAVMFFYPEKYWKIVNHYYNSNKAWFPDKDMEKLIKVLNQEEARNFFAKEFAYQVALW